MWPKRIGFVPRPHLQTTQKPKMQFVLRNVKDSQHRQEQESHVERENLGVSQIMQQRKIDKRIQVVCLAVQQRREGNTALAKFIANNGGGRC